MNRDKGSYQHPHIYDKLFIMAITSSGDINCSKEVAKTSTNQQIMVIISTNLMNAYSLLVKVGNKYVTNSNLL